MWRLLEACKHAGFRPRAAIGEAAGDAGILRLRLGGKQDRLLSLLAKAMGPKAA